VVGGGAVSSNAVKGNTLSCGHTPRPAAECILSVLDHQLHVNCVFHKTRSQSQTRPGSLESSADILHTARSMHGGSHRVFCDTVRPNRP
jgi:hypothetical protein